MRNYNIGGPQHREARSVLRVIGPVIALAGLVLTIIGIGSFFSSFGSFGGSPRYFWCAFLGLPLLAVGSGITKLAVTQYPVDVP